MFLAMGRGGVYAVQGIRFAILSLTATLGMGNHAIGFVGGTVSGGVARQTIPGPRGALGAASVFNIDHAGFFVGGTVFSFGLSFKVQERR